MQFKCKVSITMDYGEKFITDIYLKNAESEIEHIFGRFNDNYTYTIYGDDGTKTIYMTKHISKIKILGYEKYGDDK